MAKGASHKSKNRPAAAPLSRPAAATATPPAGADASSATGGRAAWIWCALFCACVLVLVLSTVITAIRTYTPLPKWDYWAEIEWLKSYYAGTWHLSDLWAQHNEHRILFPRLFFLLDLFVFKGTNAFLLVSILVVQAGTAAVFLRESWRMKDLSRQTRVVLAGLILALLFSGLQLDNFVWSFQISFILVQFAVVVSTWSLAWYGENRSALGRLGLCLLSGVVATYSLASGVVIWPVLLMMAIGLRMRRRDLLAIAATGALMIVLYFSGFQENPGHTDPIVALGQPLKVLNFVCAYLALPVTVFNHSAGVALGGAILVAVVWQVGWFLRVRPNIARSFGMCLGTAAFLTGGAFLTALGRESLGGPEQSIRYATPASLLWASLILGAVAGRRWLRAARNLATPVALTAGITLLAVVILPDHIQQIRRVLAEYPRYEDTETAFALGIVYGAPPINQVLPAPEQYYQLVDFLRDRRLSIFAGSPAPIGEPLEDDYRIVSGNRCRGVWESRTEVSDMRGGAASVAGWAWDIGGNRPPRSILIADGSKTIRGMARFDQERTDLAEALRKSAMAGSGWFGYFRRVNDGKYRAYAVLNDGKSACPLPDREEAPATMAAVYRKGIWWIDTNRNGTWESTDRTVSFGLAGDIPVVGDWDGSGVSRLGVFRGGSWILDWNNTGRPEDARTFAVGLPGDIPVVGDWGHTGVSKFGVFRNGTWVLDWNGNRQFDSGDRQFSFGLPGDRPVVGDWDNSGVVRIGVFRKGEWILDVRGSFQFDGHPTRISFGGDGDQPVVGDWNGWGVTRIGVFRGGQWIVRSHGIEDLSPAETAVAAFGLPGDLAIPWPAK